MFTPASIIFLALGSIGALQAAPLVTYGFGPTNGPTTSPATQASGVIASPFSGHLGSPSTGGSSPLSSGAYFGATTWTGEEPGTNYFEFTLTPSVGQTFTTTTLRFDYRSTGTGPTTLALRSSADTYTIDFFTLTIDNDSIWHDSGARTVSLAAVDSSTTFRLYGYGASSNGGTLRVDNVTLEGAVPEPAAYASILGLAALATVGCSRRATRRAI